MEFILTVVIITGVFFLIKRIRGPLPPKPPVTGGGGSVGDEEGDKTGPINAV